MFVFALLIKMVRDSMFLGAVILWMQKDLSDNSFNAVYVLNTWRYFDPGDVGFTHHLKIKCISVMMLYRMVSAWLLPC